MPTKIEKDSVTGRDTTGHEWDGLKELNTPLPSWWLWSFYATILFSVVWMVLYPSVPGVRSYFGGLLGYSERNEVSQSIATAAQKQAAMTAKVAASSLAEIRKDPTLLTFASTGGKAAFNNNCAQCHQVGGAGAKGFPNLADDDWLWGGTPEAIAQTINYGVRNANSESRQSLMPKFGTDGLLKPAEIEAVADYVIALGSNPAQAAGMKQGAAVYAENCVACHGEKGEGNKDVGAPRLTDRIWLYGGDRASVIESITRARAGSMPAWGERLDPATVKMLTLYVHGLGGGQ
jgi:cytochrome c oxidase cbb3-type subunit 3